MFASECRLVRRFVGRLDHGEELVQSVEMLCEQERVRGAWIRGVGVVEWADVAEWDAARMAWSPARRITGPLTVTGLEGTVAVRSGPLAVQLYVTLVRHSDVGIAAFGGALVAASVLAFDLSIEAFEDVRLERSTDDSTGFSTLRGIGARGVLARDRPAPSGLSPAAMRPPPSSRGTDPGAQPRSESTAAPDAPAPARREPIALRSSESAAPSGGVSWAQAAAVSEATEAAEASASPRRAAPLAAHLVPAPPGSTVRASASVGEPMPGRGDWIDHRQFGLCRIDGDDEDGAVRIRLPSGVRKSIRLDVFDVLPPRVEGDRRVFPLRPRKR